MLRAFVVSSRTRRVFHALTMFALLNSCGGGGDSVPTAPTTPTPVLTTIAVSLSASSIQVGQSASASAGGADQNGSAIATGSVTWSSSVPTVATVSSTGTITGAAVGQSTITATAGGKQGQQTITVVAAPVASLTISPGTTSAVIGSSQQFTAATLDASGATLTGRTVTWSTSDATKASVSTTGLVSTQATGAVTITATSEGKSANAQLTVTPVPVAAIAVSPATSSVTAGSTLQLAASVKDAAGNTLLGRTITWTSSDATRATVNTSGLVSGVAAGSVTISAQVDDKVGTASLGVTSVPVATVTLTPSPAQVYIGATTTLTATLRDKAGNTLTGRTVVFTTSSAAIATVSPLGVVTGVAAGSATITATAEGQGSTSVVTVSSSTSSCATTRPITMGQTVSSTLIATDCKLSDGSYYQLWSFTLASATALRIDMKSSAIDAYLLLVDASTGALLTQNDDGGGAPNARIDSTFAAGRYLVYANTYSAGELGAYQLTLAQPLNACTTATVLPIPTTALAKTLSTTSCQLPDGTYADRYTVTVNATSSLAFTMTSTAVDAYLLLQNSAGTVVAQDDNGAGGTNARITYTATPGTYTLLANTLKPATGAYQLSAAISANPCTTATVLTLGTTVNGTLTAGDCLLAGSYAKNYAFTLTAASQVVIDLTSTAFDAFLGLADGVTGAAIASDDDSGGNSNSRIAANLPAGQYVVQATSFTAGATGAFTIRVAQSTVSAPVTVILTPATTALSAGATVQLNATVAGNTNTGVRWQSSNVGVADVSTTGLVRGITAGTATITATSLADLTKFASATVTVTASSSSAPNLDIAAAYVVQSVQTLDGRIPLVANRGALARVFVRGSQAGLAAAKVRVRVYSGATLLGTYTGTGTPTTTVNEACCSADIALPSSVIRAGISVLADVDPDNTVAESNETDNSYPRSGTAQALTVNTVADFNVRLVPVRQSKNGLTGVIGSTITSDLRSMWPMATVNATTRATYSTDLPVLDANDNNGSWGKLLREISELRTLDQSQSNYYGVLHLTYQAGITGLGYVPGTAAIGVDAVTGFNDRGTFAHELGHNFSLPHAPCSEAFSPANPDPGFPYPDGRIGVYGFDLSANNKMYAPTTKDLMSYCSPNWVSDYNYVKVMNYRATAAAAALVAPAQTAMVSGSIDGLMLSVEPVVNTVALPTADDPSGRYVVEARTSDARVLFRRRFNALDVADGRPGQKVFVLTVPYRFEDGEIASLSVQDLERPSARVERTRVTPLLNLAAGTISDLSASRSVDGATAFTWDPQRYPKIVIRDRTTGQVLGMGSSGQLTLDGVSSDEVDVSLSNGVSSVIRTITIQRN